MLEVRECSSINFHDYLTAIVDFNNRDTTRKLALSVSNPNAHKMVKTRQIHYSLFRLQFLTTKHSMLDRRSLFDLSLSHICFFVAIYDFTSQWKIFLSSETKRDQRERETSIDKDITSAPFLSTCNKTNLRTINYVQTRTRIGAYARDSHDGNRNDTSQAKRESCCATSDTVRALSSSSTCWQIDPFKSPCARRADSAPRQVERDSRDK